MLPGDPLASPCWRHRGSAAREGRGRCREAPGRCRKGHVGYRKVLGRFRKALKQEKKILAYPEVGLIITLF